MTDILPHPALRTSARILTSGVVVHAQAFCDGPKQDNGFYGHGIVNAYQAVTARS